MTEDQKTRLLALQERLVDVFLEEADPTTWSGHGKTGAKMTKVQRGNRHWDKKSAAGTMVILAGVDKLVANTKEALGREPFEGDDLDAQIAKAEALAAKRAKEVTQSAIGVAKAGAKSHGKA